MGYYDRLYRNAQASGQDLSQLQQLELTYNLANFANPWLAQTPEVLNQLVMSGQDPELLMRNAGAMAGMQNIDAIQQSLERMSDTAQRSVYGRLTEQQQRALHQMHYQPPTNEPGLIGGAMEAVGSVVAPVARTVTQPLGAMSKWQIPGTDQGLLTGALDVMTWISDVPFHMYRTIRQMEGWQQWLALGVGVAAMAALPFAAPAVMAGLGGMSLMTAGAVGMAGLGAAYGSTALTSFATTSPTEWWDVANPFGDTGVSRGERIFKTGAKQEAARLLGNAAHLDAMARDIAVNLDLEEVAQEFAGRRDATAPTVFAGSIARVAESMADVGTQEYEQIYAGLAMLVEQPEFREAVDVLNKGKISIGRDIAQLAGQQPGDRFYGVISGATDAFALLTLDPFLFVGKAAKLARISRHGLPLNDADEAISRLSYQIRNDRRVHATVDQVMTSIVTEDVRMMPKAWRGMWTPLTEWRTMQEAQGKTFETVEDFVDYIHAGTNMKRILEGKGTVQGIERIIINTKNRSQGWGKVQEQIRQFGAGLDDASLEKQARKVAKDMGLSDEYDQIMPAAEFWEKMPTELVWTPLKRDGEFLASTSYKTGKVVGDVMVKVPGGRSTIDLIGNITTMVPPNSYINLVGEGSEDDIIRFVETMGRHMNMPSFVRDEWLNTIMTQGTVGQRRAAAMSFMDSSLSAAGLRSNPRLSREVDALLSKLDQQYALGGSDMVRFDTFDNLGIGAAADQIEAMRVLHRRVGVLPALHQSVNLTIPNLREMSKMVRNGRFLKNVARITDSDIAEQVMSRYIKPGWLLRIGFIPRAAGEEGLAFWLRMGFEGGIAQEFGARAIGEGQLFREATAKLAKLELENPGMHPRQLAQKLTDAEIKALDWQVVTHARPLARMFSRNGSLLPDDHFLVRYSDWMRETLDEGLDLSWTNIPDEIKMLQEQARISGAGIKGLDRADQVKLARHEMKQALLFGREHSWRRMLLNGVDPDLTKAARYWVTTHADAVMKETSSSSSSLFDKEIVNPDLEIEHVAELDAPGGSEERIVQLTGERERIGPNDPRFANSVNHHVGQLYDDPVLGPELAKMDPLFFDWENYEVLTPTNVLDVLRAEQSVNSRTGKRFVEDLIIPRDDDIAATIETLGEIDNPVAQMASRAWQEAYDKGQHTDIDSILTYLRKQDALERAKPEYWDTGLGVPSPTPVKPIPNTKRLQDELDNMRDIIEGFKYLPPSERQQMAALWSAQSHSERSVIDVDAFERYATGNVEMIGPPALSLWRGVKGEFDQYGEPLFEMLPDGTLRVYATPQREWGDEMNISTSIEFEHSLSYAQSLGSYNSGSRMGAGLLIQMDGEVLLNNLFNTTFDEVAKNPINYANADPTRGPGAYLIGAGSVDETEVALFLGGKAVRGDDPLRTDTEMQEILGHIRDFTESPTGQRLGDLVDQQRALDAEWNRSQAYVKRLKDELDELGIADAERYAEDGPAWMESGDFDQWIDSLDEYGPEPSWAEPDEFDIDEEAVWTITETETYIPDPNDPLGGQYHSTQEVVGLKGADQIRNALNEWQAKLDDVTARREELYAKLDTFRSEAIDFETRALIDTWVERMDTFAQFDHWGEPVYDSSQIVEDARAVLRAFIGDGFYTPRRRPGLATDIDDALVNATRSASRNYIDVPPNAWKIHDYSSMKRLADEARTSQSRFADKVSLDNVDYDFLLPNGDSVPFDVMLDDIGQGIEGFVQEFTPEEAQAFLDFWGPGDFGTRRAISTAIMTPGYTDAEIVEALRAITIRDGAKDVRAVDDRMIELLMSRFEMPDGSEGPKLYEALNIIGRKGFVDADEHQNFFRYLAQRVGETHGLDVSSIPKGGNDGLGWKRLIEQVAERRKYATKEPLQLSNANAFPEWMPFYDDVERFKQHQIERITAVLMRPENQQWTKLSDQVQRLSNGTAVQQPVRDGLVRLYSPMAPHTLDNALDGMATFVPSDTMGSDGLKYLYETSMQADSFLAMFVGQSNEAVNFSNLVEAYQSSVNIMMQEAAGNTPLFDRIYKQMNRIDAEIMKAGYVSAADMGRALRTNQAPNFVIPDSMKAELQALTDLLEHERLQKFVGEVLAGKDLRVIDDPWLKSLPLQERQEAILTALTRFDNSNPQGLSTVIESIAYDDPRMAKYVTAMLAGILPDNSKAHLGLGMIDVPRTVLEANQPVAGVARLGREERVSGRMWSLDERYKGSHVIDDSGQITQNSDGTMAVGPQWPQAIREWAERIVESTWRTRTRGTTETMQIREGLENLVGRRRGNKIVPLKPGEQFTSPTDLWLLDDKGHAIDPLKALDPEFFDPVKVDGTDQPMWNIIGPMIRDHWERLDKQQRVVPHKLEAKRHWKNALKPTVPINEELAVDQSKILTRSRVQDVSLEPAGALPNQAIARKYEKVPNNLWDRYVRWGFDKVIGPSVDALVRKPMSFHYFATAYKENKGYLGWLLDDYIWNTQLPQQLGNLIDSMELNQLDAAAADKVRQIAKSHFDTDLSRFDDQGVARWWAGLGADNSEWHVKLRELEQTLRDTAAARLLEKVPDTIPESLHSSWVRDWVELEEESKLADFVKTFSERNRNEIYYTLPEHAMTEGNMAQNFVAAYHDSVPDSVWDEGWQSVKDWIANNEKWLPHDLTDRQGAALMAARNNWKFSQHQLNEASTLRAINNVVPFLDSHEQRSMFAEYGRNFIPFWYAEENFLKRWGKTLAMDGLSGGLAKIRMAQLTYNGLKSGGAIRTDVNGKDWFVYPGSGLLQEVIDKLWPTKNALPIGVLMQASTDSMLPGINDEFGSANPSPIIGVPLNMAMQMFPELNDTRREIIGDMAVNRAIIKQFVPSTIANLWDVAFADEGSSTKYGSAMMAAIAYAEANGQGLPEEATADQTDEYLDRIRNHTRIILLTQAITGYFVPGAPSALTTGEDTGSFSWLTGIGVDDPKQITSTLYREYLSNMGVEEGTRAFLAAFPNADLEDIVNPMAFTTSASASVSGAPLPATKSGLGWYQQNRAWIDGLPEAGAWFLPPDDDEEDFDYYAYSQQLASGLRKRRTPEEFLRAIKYRQGADVYFESKRRYDETVLKVAENPAVKAQLDTDWAIWKDEFMNAHPIFAEELQSGDARVRRDRTIEQLRYAVYDPQAPVSPHTDGIRQMVEAFDSYHAARKRLSMSRTAENRERLKNLQNGFGDWVGEWILRNPHLERLWSSVYEPQADLA